MSDKQLETKKKALIEQVRRIARPRPNYQRHGEIQLYNKMVMGIQNYYRLAARISQNASKLNRAVMTVITSRLQGIRRKGRKLTSAERACCGQSAMLRYLANTGQKFTTTEEIRCHHKQPESHGGTDDYQNLILVTATVHKLIHAANAEAIRQYLQARH